MSSKTSPLNFTFAFHFWREIAYKCGVSNPPNPWQAPLAALRGVGPERAAQLARLELRCVGDLLLHRPRRYEDRRHFQRIAELKLELPALTCGKIIAARPQPLPQRGPVGL